MSLDVNLLGLGLPYPLAERLATAGPTTSASPAGSSATDATAIRGGQRLLAVTGGTDGTKGFALPPSASIGVPPYVVANAASGATVVVYVATGSTISGASNNNTAFSVANNTAVAFYKVTSVLWVAVKGA